MSPQQDRTQEKLYSDRTGHVNRFMTVTRSCLSARSLTLIISPRYQTANLDATHGEPAQQSLLPYWDWTPNSTPVSPGSVCSETIDMTCLDGTPANVSNPLYQYNFIR
jgi:hypothetical protein